jgi:hypothetical protein
MSTKINSVIMLVLVSLSVTVPVRSWAGEEVKAWVGVLEDYFDSHDAIHTTKSGDHPMKFTRSSDGESFTVVGGIGALLREHLESDKTLLVEIDGRITSKFLFFGGNLIITDSKVLQQVAQVDHRSQRNYERSDGPRGGSGRRR